MRALGKPQSFCARPVVSTPSVIGPIRYGPVLPSRLRSSQWIVFRMSVRALRTGLRAQSRTTSCGLGIPLNGP